MGGEKSSKSVDVKRNNNNNKINNNKRAATTSFAKKFVEAYEHEKVEQRRRRSSSESASSSSSSSSSSSKSNLISALGSSKSKVPIYVIALEDRPGGFEEYEAIRTVFPTAEPTHGIDPLQWPNRIEDAIRGQRTEKLHANAQKRSGARGFLKSSPRTVRSLGFVLRKGG